MERSSHRKESSEKPLDRKALDGTKVVEWSHLVAGPYCAKLLADLGAEVIKIEKPGTGDEARCVPPFVHDDPHPEQSLLFLYLNTNKSGVTLDIENPSGREKFLELVKWADILIEDNPPRITEGLKLTYRDLNKLNPGLIVTSISPFGQTGPYRDYRAYPLNTYHSSGMGYFSPMVSEVRTPLKPGRFFGECACGLIAAGGTLGALYHQRVTGLGQQVDISKQEALLNLVRVQVDRYPFEGQVQSRVDTRKGSLGMITCKDGYIAQAGGQPREWQALIRLIAGSEMDKYEKYLDADFRQQNWDEISQLIAEWMLDRTQEEIYHQGQALGCPIVPVMTAEDIVKSPQSSARQFFVEANHPVAGKLHYPVAAYRFSATPPAIERSAPLLGQHNQEVFSRRLQPAEQGSTVAPTVKQLSEHPSPLHGIRVADFSWQWAGPYATELLACLGAEVIKIESMRRIDTQRSGTMTTDQTYSGFNASFAFNEVNLGKLGIRLNLSQPKAIELAKKLVGISDIVVQNMRPGVMERLGLGYEVLKKVKPDIIYLSSSARGATGPERAYSGYASLFAALGGICHVSGVPDGEPARLTGEIDLMSAVTSTFAILAALNHRLGTGEGQHIDLSSSEAVSVFIGDVLMDYLVNGRVQTRTGNLDDFMAPHNCYRCQGEDKWISIAIATDKEWEALCQVMGSPGWAREQRFLTASARWQNQEELDRLVGEWTANRSHYEAMEMLQEAGVAAMPCFNSEELYKNPHLNHRQCWTKVSHPVLGEKDVLAPPWKLSATPARVTSASPLLGEHSHYVFTELLGLSEDELARLEAEEVIY